MNLEDQIKDAGADKAPRITPADVEANIASEHYFTAADGVIGVSFVERQRYITCETCETWRSVGITGPMPDVSARMPLCLLTFCVLVLKNGFTVTGESACASPENFNAEIGRKIARQKAVDKVWPLMGYELRTALTAFNDAS